LLRYNQNGRTSDRVAIFISFSCHPTDLAPDTAVIFSQRRATETKLFS